MRYGLLTIAFVSISSVSSLHAKTLQYGSRVGMYVDVVSTSGLSTEHAVIHTRHTRRDAIAFCRDYVLRVSTKCISETLAIPLTDPLIANCPLGTFTDFGGMRWRFSGIRRSADSMAKFRLTNLNIGEEADGSMASGYGTSLDIFRALCPIQAPPQTAGY